MKMCNDNMLKEENTTLGFPRFKNGDGIQKVMASMPNDQAHEEGELHTLEDMRWNDNHQCPIKYRSRDIIKSMRLFIQQPTYANHSIYATQSCNNSDPPPKPLSTEMHTADWGKGDTDKERYLWIITC